MIQLPKDADGREIPLDTKVLYGSGGTARNIVYWVYTVDSDLEKEWGNCWRAVTDAGRKLDHELMYLTPPDSWEKLEEDLQRITADPTEWFCMYAGRDKRDTGCHSNCSNCKFFKDNRSCEKQAVLDIVFRIRKLRGEGDA